MLSPHSRRPSPSGREYRLDRKARIDYVEAMSKQKKQAAPKKAGRDARTGRFVVLKDGRKLVVPPSGGKFTKREIERAVRSVVAARREKASAG